MQGPLRKDRILYTGETFAPSRKNSFWAKRVFVAPLVVLISTALFVSGIMAMRYEKFRVSEIKINGVVSLDEGAINETVSAELVGNIFFLIPRNNFLVVAGEKLEGVLVQKFPKIEKVDIKKASAAKLEINVAEREIWGIGCVSTEVEEVREGSADEKANIATTIGPCFYIDRTGFAFEDVFSFEGGLFPVLYKLGAGDIGSQLFERGDADFFEEADKTLSQSLQLPLLSAEFPSSGEDVRLTLKEGWSLIVTRSKLPSSWVSVLRTLLNGEIKEKRTRLDYADLRFGNKVFYKFR